MKVTIKNQLNSIVAKEGIINYIMPTFATIIIECSSDENVDAIYLNNELIFNRIIEINNEANIDLKIIFLKGNIMEYHFRSILTSVEKIDIKNPTRDYAKSYAKFSRQLTNIKEDYILEGIKNKNISIFAIDEFINISSKQKLLKSIRKRYNSVKRICNRPKTHLKSTNEVRPIETVKRVGYESIPYLSSHSEDWQAKTASGLKPARLFSRVEETNYEIYENRVVKSTIDFACKVLKLISNKDEEDYEQLKSIYDAMFASSNFGFDKEFQKALSNDLLSDGENNMEQIGKSRDNAIGNRDSAKELLKLFSNLKDSKLIKKIKKSKNVSAPLKDTNILLMDKDYKVLPEIWDILHDIIGKKTVFKEKNDIDSMQYKTYLTFCLSIVFYALYSLNFIFQHNGKFERKDGFSVLVSKGTNFINIDMFYQNKCEVEVINDIISPIGVGENFNGFEFDGKCIIWENKKTNEEIEGFCKKLITGTKDYKIQNKERNLYMSLKKKIIEINSRFLENKRRITILPLFGLIDESNNEIFDEYILNTKKTILDSQKSEFLVVALPICSKFEQKKITYGKEENDMVSILPISIFEINSYRRIQKVILKVLAEFLANSCPFCGGELNGEDGRFSCYDCGLIITDTQCANEKCKHKYRYLYNDVNDIMLCKIKEAEKDFYIQDSLFQYRDIVPLNIDNGIRPICPKCGK